MLAGFLGYWLLRYLGVPFETMLAASLAVGLALVIGYPLGTLVGYFLSRDGHVDSVGYRGAAWANLVVWLVPVLGTTMSAITYQFSRRSASNEQLYRRLSTIGGLLAIATAGLGGALEMTERAEARGMAQSGSYAAERSPERCPYAAREAWSREEVQAYCE